MDLTLDQVRQQLAGIHDELLALPPDAFDRRSELKDRQNELRQLSHELAAGLPLQDQQLLKAAFDQLSRVRDRLLDERLSVTGEGAGDAGIDNIFIGAINRAIDAGLGLDDVERRMEEILVKMKNSG